MDANANNIEATFDLQTVELQLNSNIQQQNFDAIFEINAAGTTWGSIDGNIENQADLIAVLNSKATNEALTALATTVTNNYTTLDTKIDGVQSDLSGDISVLNTAVQNEATTRANNDTLLQNGINTLTSNLSAEISNRTTADNTLQSNITAINNTLSGYGNIVTHNVSEFATAAQGLLADTALQPNDNITKLTNNAGYITLSALNGYATEDFVTSQGYLSSISSSDVTNALGYTPYNATNPNGYISGINSTDVVTALGYTPYDSSNPDGYITSASLPTVNNNTITIQKNSTDVGSFTLNQSSNDTINITVPTDTNDLTNGAGFITSASLPTLEDLTTTSQLAAINSGATTTNIGQIATNATDIGNEVTNRQNADNALQSQIDAIVASSDVFDIVGTYAELQAYDITTVPVNDIIKVLVDSTHNNAATYYRCVENDNVKSWSYIGSEGAYYTKGEADSKFVEQTITINGQPLSSNVTLTASDVNALPSSTTIGAGVLTVQKNGTTIDTFGANDTGNTTINITVPTDTGDLTNNAGFITGITGTDVTTALGYTPYDSSNPSGYTSNVGTVTSVNNVSPDNNGNVTISIPSISNLADKDLSNLSVTGEAHFQAPLVSGTNIKTINSNSLLGSGDITINSLPSQTGNSGKFLTTDGTDASWATVDALPSQTGNSGKLLTTNGSAASWTGIKTINSTSLLGSGDIKALQNTATGTNALTILGNASNKSGAINIGVGSNGTGQNAVAVGEYAGASNTFATSIGCSSSARSASSIAIGANAKVETGGTFAIQLGYGTNYTSKTLNVGFGLDSNNTEINYQLLDGTTGLIPDARISSNIARTSDIPSLATTSTAGIVQPDNSTITVSNGVISATPARNIGEIVHSTIPLTDAGLHLLDGSLISGSGSYADFVTYISGLVSTYPDLFETEANWQTSVTTYGVCGKFVYDSTNNTVRLPKITGIIEGTVDATALGDLVEAGLPNITGEVSNSVGGVGYTAPSGSGCFYVANNQTFAGGAVAGGTAPVTTYFDASRSSSIYGNSTTVQPQTIKAFIYIVIANSVKLPIQINIDNVATDLNGKAGTDLANLNNTGKIAIAHNSMPSGSYDDLTLGASGSSYTAPADGWFYLNKNASAIGQYLSWYVGIYHGIIHSVNTSEYTILVPIAKGNSMTLYDSFGGTVTAFRFIYAVGSESEAS